MTESQLRYLLTPIGRISFIDFPIQPNSSRPIGYAYVKFDGHNTSAIAKDAVNSFDGHIIDGSKLEVGLY